MLGRKQEFNLQLQQIADGTLLVLAFWTSHVLRTCSTYWFDLAWQIPPFAESRWLLILMMPFGPILLELQGFYNHPLQKTAWKSITQMLRASFWLGLLVAGCVIFFRLEVPSRSVLIIFGVIGMLLLLAREKITSHYLKQRAKRGSFRESVLLAGSPLDMERLRRSLTPELAVEMDIVGEIDVEKQSIAELVQALHHHSVSRVIFAGDHTQLGRIQDAIAACEVEGVEAWLVADFIKTSIARPVFDMLGSRPMLVFSTTPEISWALMVKSIIDRTIAVVLLIPGSILFLIAAVGIRLTSPGPIIFRQTRAGRHGKPFTMYKFRSMHSDAEMRRAELEAFNEMSGPVFKVEKDPRITKFGSWLRKTSIDELPQLINVLQGHMSLVGPRPLPIYEVEKFENTAQRRRLSVKPGLTCLWQVSGRNKVTDFSEWVKLDLKYIDNWSIWLDLKILLKTIPVVLLGLGAK
jgi:exopolysaccharide biosynthesis polyprenyl glycosylphosphotransferase